MASDPINVRGVILSSREFKEKDRILTVLTPDRGIVSFCVKGVASKNAKNAFVSVPFMLCDFVLTKSGNFSYMKEGSIIESNSKIMESLEAMAVAGHIGRILSESVLQTDNAKSSYELCVYAYYALGKFPQRYQEIYCAFNWRVLTDSGFADNYDLSQAADTYYISTKDSSIFDFKKEGLFKISSDSVKALNYFAEHKVSEIFNVTLNDKLKDELRRFTTMYIQNQFEYEIKDPIKQLEINLRP